MKRLKRFFMHKTKTGASLLVVLVTVSMLVVMGTTFGFIALSAYNNSQRRVNQQQAFFTADACLHAFRKQLEASDKGTSFAMGAIKDLLDKKGGYAARAVEDVGFLSPTPELTMFGTCNITAEYADEEEKVIRLISTATVNGFTESVSARVVSSNKGALEISNIFKNSQCWESPIVTLVAGHTEGDIYFSSPGEYARTAAGEIITDNTQITFSKVTEKDPVTGEEKQVSKYIDPNNGIKYDDPAGYNLSLRDNVYKKVSTGRNTPATSSGGASADKEGEWAHTKPFAIDNRPLDVAGMNYGDYYNQDTAPSWYNDWVEIYMYSGEPGTVNDPIVDGNLYVNTKSLIGLHDKGALHRLYWKYLDSTSEPDKLIKKYVAYNTAGSALDFTGGGWLDNINNLAFRFDYDRHIKPSNGKYVNGYAASDIEHGMERSSLFYDFYKYPPEADKSKMCHNGNMYLFDDARIECYDSTHTPNARNGIKNNIYAHKNLVVDGFVPTWSEGFGSHPTYAAPTSDPQWKKNVNIYGDIMCEGNLTLSNCTIYGDIYCNGGELLINDADIFGNIYYNGSRFLMDYSNVWGDVKEAPNGTMYSFDEVGMLDKNGNKRYTQLHGGNVYIKGQTFIDDKGEKVETAIDKKTGKINNIAKVVPDDNNFVGDRFGQRTAADDRPKDDPYYFQYGAIFTNSRVSGNVFSEVNTKIRTAYWKGGTFRDQYGYSNSKSKDEYQNMICTAYLSIDLSELYNKGDRMYDAAAAFTNNKLNIRGIATGKRVQIIHNDIPWETLKTINDAFKDFPEAWTREETDECIMINIGTLMVGDCGLSIDGSKVYWYKGDLGNYFSRAYRLREGIYESHKSIRINTLISFNPANTSIKNVSGGNKGGRKTFEWDIAKEDNEKIGYNRPSKRQYEPTQCYLMASINNSSGSKLNNACDVGSTATLVTKMKEIIQAIINADRPIDPDTLKPIEGTLFTLTGNNFEEILLGVEGHKGKHEGGLSEYLLRNRFPRRANAYYQYVHKEEYDREYDKVNNISRWADYSEPDKRGLYPRFDEKNPTGVWRTINVKRWSAPNFENIPEQDIFEKDSASLTDITLQQVVDAGFATNAPNDPKTFIINRGFNVVRNRVTQTIPKAGAARRLVVGKDEKLILDSSAGNLHIKLEGGLRLCENAQILLRGGHATFLYLGQDPPLLGTKLDSPTINPNAPSVPGKTHVDQDLIDKFDSQFYVTPTTTNTDNQSGFHQLLIMEPNSKIGIVSNSQEDILKRDCIYLISNQMGSFDIRDNAQIFGYIYAPKGFMYINLSVDQLNTEVIVGSMLVKSFTINTATFSDEKNQHQKVLDKFNKLVYRYDPSPILMDSDIHYGDTQDEIYNDYGKIDWGFIGFD